MFINISHQYYIDDLISNKNSNLSPSNLHIMNKHHNNSTQTPPLVVGEPVFKTIAPRVIPILQRQIIPIHTQTTVVMPLQQHHLSVQPRARSSLMRSSRTVKSPVKGWYQGNQNRNNMVNDYPIFCPQIQHSFNSPLGMRECQQDEIEFQNRRIKSQNQQLRIQNELLQMKIEILNRRKRLEEIIQSQRNRGNDMLETASSSLGFDNYQEKLYRIRSQQKFKDFQLQQAPIHNAYLVKCCDNCAKNILKSPLPLNKIQQKREIKNLNFKNKGQRNNRVGFKHQKEQRIKEGNITQRIGKQQDVNEVIMRLKQSNKLLKSRTKYI